MEVLGLIIAIVCLFAFLVIIVMWPLRSIFTACARCGKRYTFGYMVYGGEDMSYSATKHWAIVTKCFSCGHEEVEHHAWPPRPDGA